MFWEQLHCDQILKGQGFSERQCRLAEIQVVARLVAPSSELSTVSWFARSALDELMPGAAMSLNKDRLYRISDRLYAHRAAIERELAARERELFALEETIILYDLSSTYFEGVAANNEKAAHGYSRDHRSDRKQVVVGLVLDGEGFPKAHEVFAGNTKDQHTLAQMLDSLQHRMGGLAEGRATVVMDRGLATDENVALLRERGHHYIVTTKQSERQELFGEVDKTRFEPVKVDEQGQTTVSAQLRPPCGGSCTCCATARHARARIGRSGSGSHDGSRRMPRNSRSGWQPAG